MKYVLGFLFSEDKKKVVLIKKTKPKWQAGHLNGVGGKVEEGETFLDAMVREFKEETGVDFSEWQNRCHMSDAKGTWIAEVFVGFGDVSLCKTMEEEEIQIHEVSSVQDLKVIPNLKWMVPLMLDTDVRNEPRFVFKGE